MNKIFAKILETEKTKMHHFLICDQHGKDGEAHQKYVGNQESKV
jgi:hypothetical protein